jgi:hypothetical protein
MRKKTIGCHRERKTESTVTNTIDTIIRLLQGQSGPIKSNTRPEANMIEANGIICEKLVSAYWLVLGTRQDREFLTYITTSITSTWQWQNAEKGARAESLCWLE